MPVTQVKMTRPMATTIIPQASSVGLVKKSNIAAPFWWEYLDFVNLIDCCCVHILSVEVGCKVRSDYGSHRYNNINSNKVQLKRLVITVV